MRSTYTPGRFRRYAAACAMTTTILLLNGCSSVTTVEPATASAPVQEITAVAAAPTAPSGKSNAVCAAQTPQKSPGKQTQQVKVEYDEQKDAIVIGKGTNTTLAAIGRSLNDPAKLRELAPGEWLLATNLRIEQGGALHIGGEEVQRLKLKSDTSGFVSIKVLGGKLTFDGICVTSWDAPNNRVDEDYADGRSFVLARDGATMTIRNAELSYLGYDANESYGLAWRLNGTSGEISDSTLGYNYYGLYTYEASDLVIRGNEVHHSIRYGIDPHTKSKRLLIEDNVSHHNGKHGIILAEECSDSTIRNNVVYDNAMHGIVLYQRSNGNTVEGNTSYGNGFEGINLNESSENAITGNTVYGNAKAGIGVGQKSNNNTISGNLAHTNQEDGIALYSGATDNVVKQNEVRDNKRYGVYAKSVGNEIAQDNQLSGNAQGDVR